MEIEGKIDHLRKSFTKSFEKSSSKPNNSKTNVNNFLTNTRTTVDSFIDNLVDGKETLIPHVTRFFTPQETIKQELELTILPPVDLLRLGGNPVYWPEFIDNFYHRIYKKLLLNDSLRMGDLTNSLDGEDKRSVKSVGTNGYFYATALRVLKRDLDDPLVVSHLKLKKLSNQKQINIKYKLELRLFHQQIQICIPLLSLIGYGTPLTSNEILIKALSVLPIKYQGLFFKYKKYFNMLDETVNLTFLEHG